MIHQPLLQSQEWRTLKCKSKRWSELCLSTEIGKAFFNNDIEVVPWMPLCTVMCEGYQLSPVFLGNRILVSIPFPSWHASMTCVMDMNFLFPGLRIILITDNVPMSLHDVGPLKSVKNLIIFWQNKMTDGVELLVLVDLTSSPSTGATNICCHQCLEVGVVEVQCGRIYLSGSRRKVVSWGIKWAMISGTSMSDTEKHTPAFYHFPGRSR